MKSGGARPSKPSSGPQRCSRARRPRWPVPSPRASASAAPDEAGPGPARANERALCGAADPSGRPRGSEGPASEPRALLRLRVCAGRTCGHGAEPLLSRRASSSRRPHHDRPEGRRLGGRPTSRAASSTTSRATLQTSTRSWPGLCSRYGVNKSRLFVLPDVGLRMFFLNTRRPLFKDNVKLRQALNFAVDRRALVREYGLSCGYCHRPVPPAGMAGYRRRAHLPAAGPGPRGERARSRKAARAPVRRSSTRVAIGLTASAWPRSSSRT